jgi:hypothetical protein
MISKETVALFVVPTRYLRGESEEIRKNSRSEYQQITSLRFELWIFRMRSGALYSWQRSSSRMEQCVGLK